MGFVLRFGESLWKDALKTGIDLLKKVGDDTQILQNLDTDKLDLGSIVLGLAIGLIVGGLVLCIISVLGCCGACYKITIVLLIVSIYKKRYDSEMPYLRPELIEVMEIEIDLTASTNVHTSTSFHMPGLLKK